VPGISNTCGDTTRVPHKQKRHFKSTRATTPNSRHGLSQIGLFRPTTGRNTMTNHGCSVYLRYAKPKESSRTRGSRNATVCVATCPTQVQCLTYNHSHRSNHKPSEMAIQFQQGCESRLSAVYTISSTKTINHTSAVQISLINMTSAYNTFSAIQYTLRFSNSN